MEDKISDFSSLNRQISITCDDMLIQYARKDSEAIKSAKVVSMTPGVSVERRGPYAFPSESRTKEGRSRSKRAVARE